MKTFVTGLALLVFVTVNVQAQSATLKAAVDTSLVSKDAGIKWMTIQEAETSQKKNPKKLFVYVYATWCRWCKLEDSLTFRHKEIVQYINQNFYAVKLNAEKREPLTFKGVRYDFIDDDNKFVHDFARYLLNGRLSYPGVSFLNEQGNLISSKNGYMDAYYLEAVLNYYGSDAYKKVTYHDYEFEFEGKIEE